MYRSRHTRNNTKRILLLSAIIALLVFVTVGGTIAYITDTTDSVSNIFTPSKVTTAVVETAVGDPASGVMIKNTNNTQAYIRAAVVVTWQNESGDVYAKAPVEGTDYTLNWVGITNGSWDYCESDGYYYYTQPVDPDETTSVLFSGLTQIGTAPADGFSLNVEVLGSGIQSTPTSVVVSEWGVTLNTDGVTIGK